MILSSCSSGQPVQAALLEEREEREERRSLGGGMGLGDDMFDQLSWIAGAARLLVRAAQQSAVRCAVSGLLVECRSK